MRIAHGMACLVSRKTLAIVLTAVALGGSAGLVLIMLNSQPSCPYLTCPPSHPIPSLLYFSHGYNRTSNGFLFAVQVAGNTTVTADLLFVNTTKASFSISPANAASYCNETTGVMRPGDICLVTATMSGPPVGVLSVKFVTADGSLFNTNLQPTSASTCFSQCVVP